ncbi:hypothetical protein SJI19_17855 [Acerihabitans sp. TG2]|uniref:hypothetical protein n=1 Tax=Acerihabitans sp. TG2 TaxID=3096008 RepID=UPI002B22896C|nr:hypothetical protein [Acerihabitans sp. TG2]MEA9392383.1 hypothetical protein [Acerihabitans sp. TG2]
MNRLTVSLVLAGLAHQGASDGQEMAASTPTVRSPLNEAYRESGVGGPSVPRGIGRPGNGRLNPYGTLSLKRGLPLVWCWRA